VSALRSGRTSTGMCRSRSPIPSRRGTRYGRRSRPRSKPWASRDAEAASRGCGSTSCLRRPRPRDLSEGESPLLRRGQRRRARANHRAARFVARSVRPQRTNGPRRLSCRSSLRRRRTFGRADER
jgi:hypothetical protein